MYLILFLALALAGVAAAMTARAVGFGRVQASQRLRSIEMYGFRSGMDDEAPAATGLDLRWLAEHIGGAMVERFKGLDPVQIRRELLGAGFYTLTPAAYVGYRFIATAMLSALLALIAFTAPSVFSIIGLGVGVTLGWRIPRVIVQRRAKERYEQIDRDLPELIDLLVVSIEAGVGLGGALQMIAIRMRGPLGDELRLMLQEQSMGLSNDQSLSKLLDRVDTPSVRSFVRSLQQGERLGVSIGTILRGLAVEMRTRRRQAAEERAGKAPVKLLFPLVFMIFPAMFVVLLGPAIFVIKDVFGF